jgi:hypothetical protein
MKEQVKQMVILNSRGIAHGSRTWTIAAFWSQVGQEKAKQITILHYFRK